MATFDPINWNIALSDSIVTYRVQHPARHNRSELLTEMFTSKRRTSKAKMYIWQIDYSRIFK